MNASQQWNLVNTVPLSDQSLLKNQSYINGVWTQNDRRKKFPVYNPASGELITEVSDLTPEEVATSIDAAAQGLVHWRHETAKQRSHILRRWFDLIMANQEDLARIMTAEQGKIIQESRTEIAYAASFIEWFAEEAKRTYGDVIPATSDRRLMTIKQPVGIVAAITPWNFPCAMITRKAAPALAAGCSIIIKPADETPLSALALAALAEQAGIPAGVFNVVTGTDAAGIGRVFTDNKQVRKLTFTGSTSTGKKLIAQCADTVKKVSMELGGNAPVIIFDDANLDLAVLGTINAKFKNAGQTCTSANRILVQAGVYESFVETLRQVVSQIDIGDGISETSQMGPLINAQAVAQTESFITRAIEQGAKVILGGEPEPNLGPCFFQPTILAEVKPGFDICQLEIFGPVIPIIKFESEAEAVRIANDTEYGLAAYLYTNDLSRIWRVSEAIEFGMIGINEVAITSETIPFGGIKASGFGREGSKYGIDEYMEVKYLCMGGLTAIGNFSQ